MQRKNYNEEITTKLLTKDDLYIGKYIQTFGNTDHIYKIVNIYDSEVEVAASHVLSGYNDDHDTIYDLEDIDYKSTQFCDFDICETLYTDKLNVEVIREKKLELLGIY
jgi:hypothetical protein